MSKISELSDGGVIQGGDTLIAVRSGGNVKVTYGGSTTANIDGGTIDGTVIGGSSAAAGSFTTLTASGDVNFDSNTLFVDASANAVGIGTSSPSTALDVKYTTGSLPNANYVGYVLERTSVTGDAIGSHIAVITGSGKGLIIGGGGDGGSFGTFDGTTATARMSIASNGDISFYEDTGTTAKFFWDASAESLGIGTSSPTAPLEIRGSNTSNQLVISRSEQTNQGFSITAGGGDTVFDSYEGTDTVFGSYIFNATKGATTSERMRIDSAGHLIVPNGITLGTAVGTYNAANTLDDYEEGTWTPTLDAGFVTTGTVTATGIYTKIGRTVLCTFRITTSTMSGTSAKLGGVPFTVGSGTLGGRGSGFFATDVTGFPIGGIVAYRSGVYLEDFTSADIGGSFTYEALT